MTPEGAALKAITQYLTLCKLGRIERINVGSIRIGEAPTHPWAKDTRRMFKTGTRGASDLVLHLATDPRDVHIEVKAPSWHPPQPPKPDASTSTREKFRHHREQLEFQAAERARGNFAFFARSPWEVYENLLSLGFKNLPVPSQTPVAAPRSRLTTLGGTQ